MQSFGDIHVPLDFVVYHRTGKKNLSRIFFNATDKDETMVSVALGYTCHLVSMMSYILNFPVRYPMDHHSSRSLITDHIHPKLTDRDKT